MKPQKNRPLRFLLLMMLSLLLQQGLLFADATVVGNLLGKELFAAIELQTALLRVPVSFAAGFAAGITIVVSHRLSNRRAAGSTAAVGLLLALSAGTFITAAVQLSGSRLLDWMAVPAAIRPASFSYLRIYISGTVFTLLFNACIGIFHAYQDAKTPLLLMAASFALNLLLDLLLVPIFPDGLAGAAFATLFSQALVALAALVLLIKKKMLKAPDAASRKELLAIVKAGLPIGAQAFVFAATNAFLQQRLNALGMEAIAAWSLCNKLDMPVWVVIDAMSISITTFCAAAYGGNEALSVKQLVTRIGGFCMPVLAVLVALLFAIPALLGRLILPNAAVCADAASLMRLLAPFYLVYACGELAAALFRSRGNTLLPFAVIVLQCATRIGLLLSFPNRQTLRFFAVVYMVSVCVFSVLLLVPTALRHRRQALCQS